MRPRTPPSRSFRWVSGDQYEALTTRLLGLAYDPKRDAFEVQLEDLSHMVPCPTEIWVVEEEGGFVSSMVLVCPDGKREIIYVRRGGPLAATLPG